MTSQRRAAPVLVSLVALLILLSPARAQTWPPRLPVPDHPSSTGVIRPLPHAVSLLGFRMAIQRPSPDDLADAKALLGDAALDARFEGSGAYIYRVMRPTVPPPAGEHDPRTPEYFVFASASTDPVPRLQRTWFAFYHPTTVEPRGTALLMPGLFGTPPGILDLVTRHLRQQGWAVLRMMSQPSLFTAKATFDLNLADPAPVLKQIAAEFDDRTAECAYAVEAAFAHLARTHPALTPLPRIAIGMSGGAMTLPTVLAREPDRYAAAVLIAGGCDFFTMAVESNYQHLVDAIGFTWEPGAPTDEQRTALARQYLDVSTLDSYHTAPALSGKPILMIHGSFDMAVPAHLGDQLWERLGKPERWVRKAGHEEVFLKLPRDMDHLMTWVADHSDPSAAPLPGRQGPGSPPSSTDPK